jgi:hypothetical protein
MNMNIASPFHVAANGAAGGGGGGLSFAAAPGIRDQWAAK